MSRRSPSPALVSALLFASTVACGDGRTGAANEARADSPRSSGRVQPTPEPAAETQLRIVDDAISIDGQLVARARPASAPGALDESLRASYALPELSDALSAASDGPAATVVVFVERNAPISHARAVLASHTGPIRLVVGAAEDPGVTLHPATEDAAPRVVVRPHAGKLRLWIDDHPGAIFEPGELDALAEAIAGLDPQLRRAGVSVDLPDERAIDELREVATAIAAVQDAEPTVPVLALDFDPCLPPPADMSCVPGGPAIVGADGGPPEEAPARELLISTFYIDRHEVTNAQYDACHEADGCRIRINRHQNIMKPFVAPDQPAMPMDFARAASYCAWAGKRLPTEWEWEKAARGPDGERYPWGDEPPSCDKAVYRECAPRGCRPYPGKSHPWDCNEHATRPVGAFPAGRYDLFEMAGNNYEWTSSAGVDSITECGDACEGRDPLGPCDGAVPCGDHDLRVLRGGSWYWPGERLRGSHRRIEKVRTGSHRLGMRCATELPFLTQFPPRTLDPRPAPPLLSPPSPEQLAIAASVVDDPIADKPYCGTKTREQWHESQAEGGRSEPHCRDPYSYLETNEPRGFVWDGYTRNLGGAYVGIGADQSFNYIASARSSWAWVMDYDPRVILHHRRMRAFILAAPTPAEFVALFEPENAERALEIIDAAYPDDPDLARMRRSYTANRDDLLAYFTHQLEPLHGWGIPPQDPDDPFGWLRNPDDYRYIRTLYQQGRLYTVGGDLLRDGAMQQISEACRALGVAVRIYYTSNAPTAWGGEISDPYRRNVSSLPFDAHSIVLRTTDGGGSLRQRTKWHHNVQWGLHMQARIQLPGYDNVWKLIEGRIPGDDDSVTILGLPGHQ